MKVYKYNIVINDYVDLWLPKGAQILKIEAQRNEPFIWALVDPCAMLEERHFRLAGTGHEILQKQEELWFIGTFQMDSGALVFHFFEITTEGR